MTSLQNNVDIIQDSLDDIKDAIINKGGTISRDITSYAEDILNLCSIGFNREISPQGVFQIPTTNFTFSLPENAIDVGNSVMFVAFQDCTFLISADLSSLTTISGNNALYLAFRRCTSLTSVDLSSLTTISGNGALSDAFDRCTSLTSVDLSSLTTISGNGALSSAFDRCTSLTSVSFPSLTTVNGSTALQLVFIDCINLTSVDLSSLTTINSYWALHHAFYKCKNLTSVDLSSLTTISGNKALYSAFEQCTSLTSLSFPSLTSTSFGSYTNQFNNMLSGVAGCTVHFPSNLQSVIGSWSDVVAGFGGTNTTVLFDLPSTEVTSNTYILTVQIKDNYCNYLSLNGTEVSHGRGDYTYTYPAGTTVAVRYDTTSQSNVTASYVMDQDRTLSIGSSTWVID